VTNSFRRTSSNMVLRHVLAILTLMAATGHSTYAQVISEHYLKGVFLYNFIRMTEWPDLARHDVTFDVCVKARSEVVDDVKAALMDKSLDGRRLAVRRIRDLHSAHDCHVIFIDGDEPPTDKELKDVGKGVLTVGETDDFLKRGGIIRFINNNGRLAFEVSVGTAQQMGLKLSSRLLGVARRVE
jgi:hypothetical protein